MSDEATDPVILPQSKRHEIVAYRGILIVLLAFGEVGWPDRHSHKSSWRVPAQSNGNLRKVRNFDKSILARERERSVAALGLRDTENLMIAGVVDRDGAPVVDHQSARVGENRVSKIVLSTHRARPPQSGRPPVRRSRH